MTFEFFTNESQYQVSNTTISKDGEITVEGNIFVFYLMLGHSAWIIVNGNSFNPPLVIKTSPITSILPHHEVYDGELNPRKHVYEVNFKVYELGQWVNRKYSCSTVDEFHAIDYVKSFFPKAEIIDTRVHSDISYRERERNLIC
jgi:hypothetical protein